MFTWSDDGNYCATLYGGGVRLYSRRAADMCDLPNFDVPLERAKRVSSEELRSWPDVVQYTHSAFTSWPSDFRLLHS